MKKPKGCAGCQGKSYLTDRKGVRFPVLCEKKQYSVLYNSVPLDVCDRKFPADIKKLLYFTMESAEECKKIYQNAKKGALSAEKHTTGLYYRELL